MLHVPESRKNRGRYRALRYLTALIGAAGLVSGSAHAAELDWNFSGFGTVAGVKTDEEIARYRLDLRQGDGASDDIDWGLHSKLGAQLKASLGEQFSVTTQAVAQRRGPDDMDPELEWLYASYRPTSWFDLRAGRLIMPELMLSDYRSVGYAQPTVTPPALVYIWASVSQFEGAQLLNRISLGNGLLSIQTSAGEADEDFWIATEPQTGGPVPLPPSTNLKFEDLRGINVTYESGNWLFRGVNIEEDATLPNSLVAPGSSTTIDQTFKGLGLQYDNGDLLVMAETIERTDIATAQYLLAGWRFGRWMPSITFVESQVTDQVTREKIDYDSSMLSLRYDVADDMALKLQWEEVPADLINNYSQWLNSYPGMSAGGDREVISFGMDFIF